MLLYKRAFPPTVYASLLLVVCGVGLVSTREVDFSSFSLAAGMLSNAAFALYSIGAKRLLQTRDARSTYAILTGLSCSLLMPISIFMEWSEILTAHHTMPARPPHPVAGSPRHPVPSRPRNHPVSSPH